MGGCGGRPGGAEVTCTGTRTGTGTGTQVRGLEGGARAGTLRLSSCHVATSGHAGGPKHHVRAVLDPA